MKIGIITIHNASNHGAALQAFASQVLLEEYGEVEVINYINSHTSKTMHVVRFGRGARDVFRVAKDLLRFFPRRRLIKKFRDFQRNFLKLTPVYDAESLVSGRAGKYDVLVSGSDQLWNPKVTGQDGVLDRMYLLDFAKPNQVRVAYATSLGGYVPNGSKEEGMIESVSSYKLIAMREASGAEIISRLINKKVFTVLDPTLMLSRDRWLSLFSIGTKYRFAKEDYVAVYPVAKNAFFKKAVTDILSKLKLRVVAIDQDPILGYHADDHVIDPGPTDFIRIFSGAKFVITNSFHGTAFAVNFEVPFLVIEPASGANRIHNLLGLVNLKDRFVPASQADIAKEADKSLDFIESTSLLMDERRKSKAFLDQLPSCI